MIGLDVICCSLVYLVGERVRFPYLGLILQEKVQKGIDLGVSPGCSTSLFFTCSHEENGALNTERD